MFPHTIPIRIRYGLAALFVNAVLLAGGGVLADEAQAIRLLVLGDSLTAGHGLTIAESFPARLERALGEDGIRVRVINAGVSGDTTAGGLARLEWALAARPHAVIVELGANDGLRGLDPAASEANLDAILGRLRDSGVAVLVAGMKAPPNLGPDYGARFDAIYSRLAARHGAVLYPFFLDGVAAVAELNQDDAIHPNAQGVDVVVGRILPYVKELIGRSR